MHRYEQHCPVARAAEVISEPWTLLILRELMRGSQLRAEIAKGVPGMSASLLGTRLRTLANLGLVTYLPGDNGQKRYQLTPAGRELRPIVDQLGRWGQRWLPEPRVGDLDAGLLIYDICRGIDRRRLPARSLTVEVEFADALPPRRWWLVMSASGVIVHRADPGPSAAVQLSCTLGALAGVWLGNMTWLQAVRERTVVLTGDPAAVRLMIDGIGASRYATVPRPSVNGHAGCRDAGL